jgi:hypothetical protein
MRIMGDIHLTKTFSPSETLLLTRSEQPPKYVLFTKNGDYYFQKTSYYTRFGWIRHISCAEIIPNSTFWRGDRESDGLGGRRQGKEGDCGGAGIFRFQAVKKKGKRTLEKPQ